MAAASGKTHYSEDVIDKVLVKGAQERLGGPFHPGGRVVCLIIY